MGFYIIYKYSAIYFCKSYNSPSITIVKYMLLCCLFTFVNQNFVYFLPEKHLD